MRFRRQTHSAGATVAVLIGDGWLPLAEVVPPDRAPDVLGAHTDDLVGLLAGGERTRDRIRELSDQVAPERRSDGTPVEVLPLRPAALRCFSEWQTHWEQAARMLARRYHPLRRYARPLITGFEGLTRRTFPPLRPGKEFFEHPIYYTGNHLNTLTDGETVEWPCYCRDLDYELELGALVVRPLHDADPEAALAAIGGFCVVNDFSARDTQWREHTDGQFGPVIKTKGFATALGAEVVSADEILPALTGEKGLTGTVSVNGQEWIRTSTAGMRNGPAAMASWASHGERVHPGEVLASGTMPSGSGMELDRWLSPGDEIRLEVELVGSLTNRIGDRPAERRRWPADGAR